MANLAKVEGVQKTIKRLRAIQKAQIKGVERGLVKAGLFLQRESQKVCPVDTSALRNSARTRKIGSGYKIQVIVSYATAYAIHVHERTNIPHYNPPGAMAKYLEVPYRRNKRRLILIVKTEAQKSGVRAR